MLNLEGIHTGEVHALLSLMCFNISRFPARNVDQKLIDLKEQDRSQWDTELIKKGFYHLKESRSSIKLTPYHLESSIASLHCSAANFEQTNWKMISSYYKRMMAMNASPIVQINYAIAISYWKDPKVGLKILDEFEFTLPKEKRYQLSSAQAEMNARLGKFSLAKSYYQVAADQANTKADVNYLLKKIEECDRKTFSQN